MTITTWPRTSPYVVWTVALLVACGSHPQTPTSTERGDCFRRLAEPAAVDCRAPVPLSADTLEHRRAVGACLLDVNRAALERAKQSALQANSLTPANLPTVTYPEIVTDEWQHTRDQLVELRMVTNDCRERPLSGETILARDPAGELVRIDLVPEITSTRPIKSCACTHCGPVPPPARVEFAILTPGMTVSRAITVAWPIQQLEVVSLVGPCS
jgi:hypothetical protein